MFKINKKGRELWHAEVSIPLQVIPMEALYVQCFLIFRKLKTNYKNFKTIFHFNLLVYVYRKQNITVYLLF